VKPLEEGQEVVGVGKPYLGCQLLDQVVGFSREDLRPGHATFLKIFPGRKAKPFRKCPAEVVAAHPNRPGKALGGQRPVELAGDPGVDLFQWIRVLPVSPQKRRNPVAYCVEAHGLVQKTIGLDPNRPTQVLPRAVSCEDENPGRRQVAQVRQEVQAIFRAQHDVQDDHICWLGLEECHGGLAACSCTDPIGGSEGRRQALDQGEIVVNDQDAFPVQHTRLRPDTRCSRREPPEPARIRAAGISEKVNWVEMWVLKTR
jgi:hypothetical protein